MITQATVIAPLTVLLIEDNPADADLIREALLDATESADPNADNVTLVHVDRLRQGEDRLGEGGIDAVLLDLSLPDSHGFDTFLRVFARFPDTAIVVLSGLDDRELAARAVREGAQDYLVKGRADGAVLARAIRYAIERKRAETERSRLERQRAEAESSLQARNVFLASISHDLKTPLTSIKGQAQLLARRVASGRDISQVTIIEHLRRIELTTTQMTDLIDDLIDVTQLEAGQPLDLVHEMTDLTALVRDMVEDYAHRSSSHSLRFDSTDQPLIGQLDGPRLRRVLANLLDNAIKFSPDGGEIAVSLDREIDERGAWAILRVQDPGVGIPPAELPHVFDRFYRASNVIGRIPGTGIGLAGARDIIEQHNGTLSVISTPGAGATFITRLPL